MMVLVTQLNYDRHGQTDSLDISVKPLTAPGQASSRPGQVGGSIKRVPPPNNRKETAPRRRIEGERFPSDSSPLMASEQRTNERNYDREQYQAAAL